jgi:hypothetical protein
MGVAMMKLPDNFVSSVGVSLSGVCVYHRDGVWYTGERVGLLPANCRLPSNAWPELYAQADKCGVKVSRKVISSEKVMKSDEVEVKVPKEKKAKSPKVSGKKSQSFYNPFAGV